MSLAAPYGNPQEKEPTGAGVAHHTVALQHEGPGACVNFVRDEGPQRVRAACPSPTWERLVSIEKKYDPTNLFRLNQNIPPA